MTLDLGIATGVTASRAQRDALPTAPTPAVRNAVRHALPGFNASTPGTATGNHTWTVNFVNESGAPITTASVVFIGWLITQTGYQAVGNDVPTTATITYSGNMAALTSGGSPTIFIPNDGQVVTDAVPLGFSIPAGATFTVAGVQTLTSGQKYNRSGATAAVPCGIAGVRTHVDDGSVLKRESLYFIGDSIMTNNSGAVLQASTGRCPCVGHSIIGTRATHYMAGFARTAALFEALGCTMLVSNFATNTLGAGGTTAAMVIGETVPLRDAIRAVAGRFAQATLPPKSNAPTVPVSSLTSVGKWATAAVPDAGKFNIGQAYAILGASPAAYAGSMFVVSRDLVANTISWWFAGAGDVPATGTITIRGTGSNWSTREFQVPAPRFEAGEGSQRAIFNAWVRAAGNVDAVLEWGDAIEIVRNDGLWPRGGDKPELPAEVTVTVASSPVSTTTITYVTTPSPTMVGLDAAIVQSGARQGTRLVTSSNVGQFGFSHAALPAPLAPGDTIRMAPGGLRATDDGLHPRTGIPDNSGASSSGGQLLLVNATKAWIDARLA